MRNLLNQVAKSFHRIFLRLKETLGSHESQKSNTIVRGVACDIAPVPGSLQNVFKRFRRRQPILESLGILGIKAKRANPSTFVFPRRIVLVHAIDLLVFHGSHPDNGQAASFYTLLAQIV
jgi:hypothetical protein